MATDKMKKSHSWWWDSHISPKNSHWLSDNLAEMDKQVKEMLTLIEEEEGDSFAKKAEAYYQQRPQLISRVEDFHRMYRSLAERYDSVTGALKKNIPKRFHSQHQDSHDGSDSNSSPEKRTKMRFDFFHKSKGSSDSDSDSESQSDENRNENLNGFNERIVELEEELKETKEKVRILEEKNSNSDELEKELLANRYEIECLKGAMEVSSGKFKAELADREVEIAKLKEEFEFASGSFSEEKSSLEAHILNLRDSSEELRKEMEIIMNEKLVLESRVSELEHVIFYLKASNKVLDEKFSIEKSNYDYKIRELSNLNAELEAKIEKLEINANENENQISQLNQTLVEITSQLVLNSSEKKSFEEKISTMDSCIDVLHLENAKLVTEIEATKSENEGFKMRINELERGIEKQNGENEGFKERINELEREIEKQSDLICENAEGKREAIRQLCMSVEYYRDGYCELRKLLQGHKRHLVMA